MSCTGSRIYILRFPLNLAKRERDGVLMSFSGRKEPGNPCPFRFLHLRKGLGVFGIKLSNMENATHSHSLFTLSIHSLFTQTHPSKINLVKGKRDSGILIRGFKNHSHFHNATPHTYMELIQI